jgi:hypothetical protein
MSVPLLPVFCREMSHRLDKRISFRQFLDADCELYGGRTAVRALVAVEVDESAS